MDATAPVEDERRAGFALAILPTAEDPTDCSGDERSRLQVAKASKNGNLNEMPMGRSRRAGGVPAYSPETRSGLDLTAEVNSRAN
jgi:hypothetical protein